MTFLYHLAVNAGFFGVLQECEEKY